jgi:hypothetical protein
MHGSYWKLAKSKLRFSLSHSALRWQLRNLWIWLLVRYSPARNARLTGALTLTEDQQERLNLYCKLSQPVDLKGEVLVARDISILKHSHYSGDLLRALYPWFVDRPFHRVFGDVTWIPEVPAFVKSRPIVADDQNAVIVPLDVRRHMCFPDDPYDFSKKRSQIVWRGAAHQEHRKQFLRLATGLPYCDVGDPGLPADHEWHKARMSIQQQMQFKYIVSVEGNDVATNLKWIMHSNSLVLMRTPRYETWFLESRLIPGVHYAHLTDDFSNLAAVFNYYEEHPNKAQEIIRAAHNYVQPFLDPHTEQLLAHSVCKAYFEATAP